MTKHGKKYVEAEKQIPAEPVSPLAAMKLLKEISVANFDETVTGDFRLGIDTRQADQQLRGTVSLPNGSGKTVRVAVFAEGAAAQAAEEAGADIVGTDELMAAVRRVSLVADRSTPIHMSFTQGNLELDAGQGDDAQATEQLVAHLEGDDISTAFNPGYLLDGLGALNQPYVRLDFTHASKPAVLTGMDSIGGTEDSSFRYLLMPIRFGA